MVENKTNVNPLNLKFYVILCFIIISLQGIMIAASMQPFDIYEEHSYTMEYPNKMGEFYIVSLYGASAYKASTWHDGFVSWLNIEKYAGCTIQVSIQFENVALDMLYLMKVSNSINTRGDIAGEREGFGSYIPIDKQTGDFVNGSIIELKDSRNEIPITYLNFTIIVPENNLKNIEWYLVCFYRHMAGYDSKGFWVNKAASIKLNITAV